MAFLCDGKQVITQMKNHEQERDIAKFWKDGRIKNIHCFVFWNGALERTEEFKGMF